MAIDNSRRHYRRGNHAGWLASLAQAGNPVARCSLFYMASVRYATQGSTDHRPGSGHLRPSPGEYRAQGGERTDADGRGASRWHRFIARFAPPRGDAGDSRQSDATIEQTIKRFNRIAEVEGKPPLIDLVDLLERNDDA